MGVVYEAMDLALQRKVALKQMRRTEGAAQEDLDRFIAEARLVAKLRHPNLAEIHAVIVEPDVYLVFDYVEGRSLDGLISDRRRLPVDEVRHILADVCGALDCAHAHKIIHRDLKPSNVMISPDGSAKVLDFGIAHQSQTGSTFTKTAASGTPPYMAPEQAMGSVSNASDLYALAVMVYELLAGRRPFDGPDFLGPKLEGRFERITSVRPDLPRTLDAFFIKALAPDPTKRFQSAKELASSFDHAFAVKGA
jgi:serine/threonine-protein kinase